MSSTTARESMTIDALEAGHPLPSARSASTRPPTSAAAPSSSLSSHLAVELIAIDRSSAVSRRYRSSANRILLIPVIAAVGYEILKYGARHRQNPVARCPLPGPARPDDDDQTADRRDDEVAIVSMEQALVADPRVGSGGLGCIRAAADAADDPRLRGRPVATDPPSPTTAPVTPLPTRPPTTASPAPSDPPPGT